MCTAMTRPVETVVKKPSENVPMPVATPDTRVLGAGAASNAGKAVKGRRLQINRAIDEATK